MNQPRKLYNYFLVLFAVTLALRCLLVDYYNNNMGGIETNVVYGIQRLLLHQPLYQDPSAGTYAVIQYTPLYYYLITGLARLLHIRASDVQSIYTLCRATALALNLLTVLIASSLSGVWGLNKKSALVAATPIPILVTSHYFLRGDSLHLLFFVAAIHACVRYIDSQRMTNLLIAGILSACCIMSKQSGVLACGIIGLWLLFDRKYIAGAIYSVVTLIVAAAIAFICSGGDLHALYLNAYLGLKNGTDLSFLYRIFISRFFIELIPCYLLGGIAVYAALKKSTDKQFRFLSLGIALSWLFALVTGLKIGSSNNYFVEFLTLLVLAAPYLLRQDTVFFSLRNYRISISGFTRVALIVVLTSKTTGLLSAVAIDGSIKNDKDRYYGDVALRNYFTDSLRLRPDERVLFTERNFLDNLFIGNGVMPTKDVVSETYLASATTYDYTTFTAGLNNGLITYIVTDSARKDMNRWYGELPFMKIDERRFRWVGDKAGYSVYKFNP